MKPKLIIVFAALSFALTYGQKIMAEESAIEKTETVKNKINDSVKEKYREIDDRICEIMNGKINCVAKSIKNKAKNTSDKLKTDTTEIINKAD